MRPPLDDQDWAGCANSSRPDSEVLEGRLVSVASGHRLAVRWASHDSRQQLSDLPPELRELLEIAAYEFAVWAITKEVQ